MKWVHENIASFGGDPSRVLIVGQSAGANSVSQHLVRPASWPYFSAAGMESGAFYDSWTIGTGVATVAQLKLQYEALVNKVGCNTEPDRVGCLVGTPAADVFKASPQWTPVVDGAELPAPGPVLASRGTMASVPTFAGYVAEDISTMVCCLEECTKEKFSHCAKTTYSLTAAEAAEMTALYSDEQVPPGANGSQWFWAAKHAGADNWAGCPSRRIARWSAAKGQQSFFYRWSHTAYNPADGGAPGHAHHALEQPFVFHVLNETAEEVHEDGGRYFIYPKDGMYCPTSLTLINHASVCMPATASCTFRCLPTWSPCSHSFAPSCRTALSGYCNVLAVDGTGWEAVTRRKYRLAMACLDRSQRRGARHW
jgi:carboxylesterase type B